MGCGGQGQVVGGLHGVNKGTKWDLQTTAFTNRLHHCPLVSLTLVGVELGVLLLWQPCGSIWWVEILGGGRLTRST